MIQLKIEKMEEVVACDAYHVGYEIGSCIREVLTIIFD